MNKKLETTAMSLFLVSCMSAVHFVSAEKGGYVYPWEGILDVFLNVPDARKALVMPCVFGSELVPGFPERKLLAKLSEKPVSLSRLRRRLREGLRLANLEGSGMCDVCMRGGDGRPTRVSRRESMIDFLVEEGKVDPDGVVMVGASTRGRRTSGTW